MPRQKKLSHRVSKSGNPQVTGFIEFTGAQSKKPMYIEATRIYGWEQRSEHALEIHAGNSVFLVEQDIDYLILNIEIARSIEAHNER